MVGVVVEKKGRLSHARIRQQDYELVLAWILEQPVYCIEQRLPSRDHSPDVFAPARIDALAIWAYVVGRRLLDFVRVVEFGSDALPESFPVTPSLPARSRPANRLHQSRANGQHHP